MKSRTRVWALSSAGALLVLGCLVLANLLARQFYVRVDLSEGRRYSLSGGSERILRALEDPVEVRAFFSRELPPEYAAHRSYVRDLLREYRYASRGKVKPELVEVGQDGPERDEAARQGIPPIQFNVISKEKYEVREGVMGIVLQHEDRREVIPVVAGTERLEYELTSRILQLTREARPRIGFVSSHGALAPESLHAAAREALERHYELVPVDLSELAPGATIQADLAGLLVLGPSEKLRPGERYAIDQFLLSGRPLVAAADARKADMRAFVASPSESGLRGLLEEYGVRQRANFVLDRQNQPVQVSRSQGFISFTSVVPYPLFVVSTALDEEHPTTRDLDSLVLPLVAPLEISSGTARGPASVLARSSQYSWLREAWGRGLVHSVSPIQQVAPEENDPRGPFALAVALEGPFRSAFAEGSLPEGADPSAHLEESRPGARLAAVGTSLFARPDMPVGDSGLVFLLNLVDWMALDRDLIEIRSKGVALRPLREIPAASKTAVRWANIAGPGLLLAGLGALRLRARRRRRARRARLYSPAP